MPQKISKVFLRASEAISYIPIRFLLLLLSLR